MSLQDLQQTLTQLSSVIHIQGLSGLSSILVVAGILILMTMIVGGFLYGIVKAFSSVPSMTTKQFIAFMILVGAIMLFIGIILP